MKLCSRSKMIGRWKIGGTRVGFFLTLVQACSRFLRFSSVKVKLQRTDTKLTMRTMYLHVLRSKIFKHLLRVVFKAKLLGSFSMLILQFKIHMMSSDLKQYIITYSAGVMKEPKVRLYTKSPHNWRALRQMTLKQRQPQVSFSIKIAYSALEFSFWYCSKYHTRRRWPCRTRYSVIYKFNCGRPFAKTTAPKFA
jgi:hypothetical protein